MKIQMMVKKVPIRLIGGLVATGFLWSGAAFAQTSGATPVSTNVHLSGNCTKCDLSRRDMPSTSFQGANFFGSDFSYTNLAGAIFNQANFDNASFYKAHLMQVRGEQVNLIKAVLRGTTLTDCSLVNSKLVLADLQKADLTNGDFTGSDFTKARLRNVDAMGAVFTKVTFTKARFDHADFTGADFSGAQLIHTKFGDADITNANFTGANLSGAELAEAIGLQQEQLDNACGSKETELPEGFSLRVCPADTQMTTDALSLDAVPRQMAGLDRVRPQSPPTPMRPMIASPMSRGNSMVSIRSTDLDDLIRGIDGIIGDMPANSPNRARLEQSKRKLQAVQTQGSQPDHR